MYKIKKLKNGESPEGFRVTERERERERERSEMQNFKLKTGACASR
jgi:hypothetical protein